MSRNFFLELTRVILVRTVQICTWAGFPVCPWKSNFQAELQGLSVLITTRRRYTGRHIYSRSRGGARFHANKPCAVCVFSQYGAREAKKTSFCFSIFLFVFIAIRCDLDNPLWPLWKAVCSVCAWGSLLEQVAQGIAESLALEMFSCSVDVVLGKQLQVALLGEAVWTRWSPNLNHLVIHW